MPPKPSVATKVGKPAAKAAAPALSKPKSPPPPPSAATTATPPVSDGYRPKLGDVLPHLGCKWRVVYAGPTLRSDELTVGLQLVPPPRLAASFLPPPTSPTTTRGSVTSEIANALLQSVQRSHAPAAAPSSTTKTKGKPNSPAPAPLHEDETEVLAIVDLLRCADPSVVTWSDGRDGDGTQYFPCEAPWLTLLMPWNTYLAKQGQVAPTGNRVSPERPLAGTSASKEPADASPKHESASPQTTEEAGLLEGASSPVVGGTAAILRRSRVSLHDTSDRPKSAPTTRAETDETREADNSESPIILTEMNTAPTRLAFIANVNDACVQTDPQTDDVFSRFFKGGSLSSVPYPLSSSGDVETDSVEMLQALQHAAEQTTKVIGEWRATVAQAAAASFAGLVLPSLDRLFESVTKFAMRPPAPHPPVPGVLLADDDSVRTGDLTLVAGAIEAEEDRDILSAITAREDNMEGMEEVSVEADETVLLQSLLRDQRDLLANVADSVHYSHLRYVARRFATARETIRAVSRWCPAQDASLQPTEEEITEIMEVLGSVESSATAALQPLLMALSAAKASEPMLDSAVEEHAAAVEAISRLRFDASDRAECAKTAESEGDMDRYETLALERLALVQAAQTHVAAACHNLFAPIVAPLCEVPKATLRQCSHETKTAMQLVKEMVSGGIRAARQARSDALAALDSVTSDFIRTSYETSRRVTAVQTALKAIDSESHDCVARIVQAASQLQALSHQREAQTVALCAALAARMEALAEFEAQKHDAARRACHAHREVLGLRSFELAVKDVALGNAAREEIEEARLMAIQRDLTERQMALHHLHNEVYRDVCLAAGEINFRKSALYKRIEDKKKTCEANLFMATETLDGRTATAAAAERDEYLKLLTAIGTTINEVEAVNTSSRETFLALSAPPMTAAGHALIDPAAELKLINDRRMQRIAAFESEVLCITDGKTHSSEAVVPTAAQTDEALARALADAQRVAQRPTTTEGYNVFRSRDDPHDPHGLD